jgi:hypothetical protein
MMLERGAQCSKPRVSRLASFYDALKLRQDEEISHFCFLSQNISLSKKWSTVCQYRHHVLSITHLKLSKRNEEFNEIRKPGHVRATVTDSSAHSASTDIELRAVRPLSAYFV